MSPEREKDIEAGAGTAGEAGDPDAKIADEAKEAKAAEAKAEAAEKPKPKAKRKPRRKKAEEPVAEEAAAEETAAEEPVAEEAAAEETAAEEPVAEEAADEPKAEDAPATEEPESEAEEEPAAEEPKPARRSRRKRDEAPEFDLTVRVRARARYVRTSARKARLVCDHIRGKSVEEARAILAFTPRAAARDWSKVLESAVANAEHNHELIGDELRITEVFADEGPTLKRYRPRAMGRATRIRKRTAHLSITLAPKEPR
jgi:ribosomal protein L22